MGAQQRGGGDGVARGAWGTESGGRGQPTRAAAQQRSWRRFQAGPGARGAQGEPLLELRGAGKSGGEGRSGGQEFSVLVLDFCGSP